MRNIESIFQKENRPFLSVFELNMSKLDSDLDEAILRAFLKAKETDHIQNVFATLCNEVCKTKTKEK